MTEPAELRPQPGPQERFLGSAADIVIYGGAAGGGKSWALLLEPLRHLRNAGFSALFFRRNTTQIRMTGSLWDQSREIYPLLGARGVETRLEWHFPTGARVKFAHLENASTVQDYHGAQVPLLCFDELTQFTEHQFWYMLSRNRSTCGVRPYVRATCNPDPDSFVADLIAWWIGAEGFPIPERSGLLRWFVRQDGALHWASEIAELIARFGPEAAPKSLTFIPSSVRDNSILIDRDPGYLANLKAQDRVTRARLLDGNWAIRGNAGAYFQRSWFPTVAAVPGTARRVRAWDLAATEAAPGKDPDWTVGLRMCRDDQGRFYIDHVERFRGSPLAVEAALRNTAAVDGPECAVLLPQDPGQAGKAQAQALTRLLAGYTVRSSPESGDKVTRARALSAQAEAGNVHLLAGPWTNAFLAEAEAFPDGRHDDQIDAAARAFHDLAGTGTARVSQYRF